MTRKKWIIVGGVVLVIIIVAAIVKSSVSEKGVGVEIGKASLRTITETVAANGKIQPQVEVSISPEVSGEVVRVTVEEGEFVEKGDLLIEINPELLEATNDRAEASVNNALANLENTQARKIQAEARLIQSRANFNRTQELLKEGAVSQSEFEQAQAEFEVAKAEVTALEKSEQAAKYTVKSARAGLKEARENLRRTQVFAPMTGTISKLLVDVGERVVGTAQMAGTEMIRIADLRNMEVNVEVNEVDIVRVSEGDTAIVEVDAYLDSEFRALVNHVANSSNDNNSNMSADQVTTFEVKMLLLPSSYSELMKGKPDYYSPFRPGMSAAVEIRTETKIDVLSVPIQAVTVREDSNNVSQECVFVPENNRVEKRMVKTGIQDGSYIEITEGLSKDVSVVSGPYAALSKTLMDNMLIHELEEEDISEAEKE